MSSSEELSTLFAAERAARPPSHAAAHGWSRLAADLAANVAPLPVAVGPLKLGLWLVPKWILAGFAVGLLGAGAASPWLAPHAASGRSTRATVQVAVSKSASAGASAIAASEAPAATPAEPRSTPEPAHSTATATAAALPSASATSATTFDAELKLISLAKAELDAHRPAQARGWLSEHAERFPNGVFVTERDALTVLASCAQGPRDAALAKAFAARHPSSPLVERVTKACGVAPIPGPSASAPRASASFETLPNDSPPLREPINEPSGGQSK